MPWPELTSKEMMRVNYLAFDVGGTNVKYAVIDEQGNFFEKGKFKSPKTSLCDLVSEMGKVHREFKDAYEFQGIALSVPGAPHNDTGLISGDSALRYLHGPNVREALLEETGLFMYAENDAKSAALGEVWMGAAKDVNDAVFLIIGTGVGGALVKDKKVHHGADLLAGEFSYIILDFDFKKQSFVNAACLACTGSLVRDVAERKGISFDQLTGEEIFAAADAGDLDCYEAIETFYESLAVVIFNLMYIYDPEMILLGGAISAREDLIAKLEEKLAIIKSNFGAKVSEVNPEIVTCEFGADANLLGAVCNFRMYEKPE